MTLTSVRDNGDIRSWSRAVKGISPRVNSTATAGDGNEDKDDAGDGSAAAYFFDPEFLCHAWKLVHKKGEKPSSGLVGVVLA